MNTSSAYVSDLAAGILDSTPLTTSQGLTFAYVGQADAVDVAVMEDRFPPVGAMRRVEGKDVWYAENSIDPDGSIEYKIGLTRHGKRRLILDPKNPQRSTAPFGPNSVASGPEYREPDWLDDQSPRGRVELFPVQSRVWDMLKNHQLYVPHKHDNKSALPLLIVHDGPEYVQYAGLDRCLDFLIATGRIPPILALLHQPHSRNEEYVDNASHFEHVFEEVLPQLTDSHPFNHVYAGGASLGGVAALLAAFRNPGAIEGLMLQSGSLVFELGGPFKRGPVLKPVTEALPLVLRDPGSLPENLVLSCGTYDGLVEDHRILIPKLRHSRPNLKYAEINAGHHWRCWRDRLESDLFALLGSP